VASEVTEHYHANHTEHVMVVLGTARMIMNDSILDIGLGNLITIPAGTPHSVLPMKAGTKLNVISVQSPFFNGSDRVLINSVK
jgi:mannose-6-phosphate isomerase-like protein (cupin superfamily)